MDALTDLASLRLDSQARLDNLPIGVLRAIFQHLNTAQSLARLARASKALREIVEHHGWNVFVRTHFGYLDLPPGNWKTVAKPLTWQTRAWERRALLLSSLVSSKKLASPSNRGRGVRGGRAARPAQTFPPSLFVDAASHMKGKNEEELVAWGIGEDVVVRWRELRFSAPKKEKWTNIIGQMAGFKAGQDDVSALSLVKDGEMGKALMMLVGRASGYLQLVSTHHTDTGRTIAWLQPESTEDEPSGGQNDIQHIAVNMVQSSATVATKGSVLFYPLPEQWPDPDDLELDDNGNPAELLIHPVERYDMKAMDGSAAFRQIRHVGHMHNGDVALALSGTAEPLRFLSRTPPGVAVTNAAKMQASSRCTDSYNYTDRQLQTSRCVLPLDAASAPGGSGYTVLSSYDDGTIRLQDMRTPSAIDTIYQDHFELTTPTGPLLADGLQRFIAGSARTSVVKIFDYRWPKSYHYTDAMPCSQDPLGPAPKPLTWTAAPQGTRRARCCYLTGAECDRHMLAKTDFYRPNCNVYLPNIYQDASPVYSLARASPTSPSVYAGLSGELVTVSLRDQVAAEKEAVFMRRRERKSLAGYSYHESLTSLVETGDGIALRDISDSQRVPAVRKHGRDPAQVAAREEFSRLDEWLM
ncbi:Cyclin-like F-box [Cordyceps fumosorosea ARSEF 2679]|uniref:Cyclin-like F-box n=1 Tax=Cordyceps fumosorosea (strain ARSEF 2679) TaxID=1081104 RepID=A0A167LMU5_CORFA|nr:Cyclin-like F-box [Cordyceps fumosorosea ARSEF 2679]OAA53273.1 Cyclin-like F-box [Cordyceps fumosorosea ARSEF 2679]